MRRLKLALRIDHLRPPQAFRFGLLGDRPDHDLIEVHLLQFDVGDLDAPGVRLFVQEALDVAIELVPFGEHFVEFMLAQDRT